MPEQVGFKLRAAGGKELLLPAAGHQQVPERGHHLILKQVPEDHQAVQTLPHLIKLQVDHFLNGGYRSTAPSSALVTMRA